MAATTDRTDRRPHRRGHRLARGQLGPRPHRRGVVGPPRPLGLGGPHAGRPSGTARACRAPRACACMQTISEFGALGAPGGLGTLLAGPDDLRPRHRRAEAALPPRHRHRQAGVVPAVQRARRRLRPRRAQHAAPSSTATSGSSTGRRCGPRAAHWSPTSACCSPAPTPTSPKHQGITYFVVDMHQPGVEVRPLREMTGPRDVQRGVPHRRPRPRRRRHRRREQRLGGRQHHADVRAQRARRRRRRRQRRPRCPGTVGGDLARRAGDFVRPRDLTDAGGGGGSMSVQNLSSSSPASNGTIDDPDIRQSLVQLHIDERDRPLHQPPPAGAGEGGQARSPASATSPSSR